MNLKKLYDQINEDYYGGCLPKDVTVEWSKDIPERDMAGSHAHGVNECNHEFNPPKKCVTSYIRVHPRLKKLKCFAATSVIHEMVHISAVLSNPKRINHGRHFHEEMARLAGLGAFDPWW